MRQRTIEAFEEWKSDVNVPAMLMSRVGEGESLKEICKSAGMPYSLVARWIAETPVLKAQYDAALQLKADSLAHEALDDANGATNETVAPTKLRVDTKLKLAGKWDRARYGEREAPQLTVNVSLGDVAREIVLLEEKLGIRAPVTLEHEPQPAAIPAPREVSEAEMI